MKILVTILASVFLVVLLSTMFNIKLSSKAHAFPPSPNSAAEIIKCYESYYPNTNTNPNFTVIVASSSSNAPTISIGSDCAQTLAGLLSAGFEILNTMPDSNGGFEYTLINQVDKHAKG